MRVGEFRLLQDSYFTLVPFARFRQKGHPFWGRSCRLNGVKLLMACSLQGSVAYCPYLSLSVRLGTTCFSRWERLKKSIFRTSWDALAGSSQDAVKLGRTQGLPRNKNKLFRRIKIAPSKKYFFKETCVLDSVLGRTSHDCPKYGSWWPERSMHGLMGHQNISLFS